MSVPATQWVYEHCEARKLDRLVMLAIADEADAHGLTAMGPGQRRLAEMVKEPQSNVARSIRRLEAAGELLVLRPVTPAPGRSSRYCMTMGREAAELATRLGWPAPLPPDPEVVEEWEQLALDSAQMRAQHAAAGYVLKPRSVPVVPYPQPVDDVLWTDGTAPNRATQGDSVPRQTESPMSGAIPLSPTTDPRTRPVEEVLAADARARAEAVPMPEHLRDRLVRGNPEGEPAPEVEPDPRELPPEPDPEPVSVPDTWAERKDLA